MDLMDNVSLSASVASFNTSNVTVLSSLTVAVSITVTGISFIGLMVSVMDF